MRDDNEVRMYVCMYGVLCVWLMMKKEISNINSEKYNSKHAKVRRVQTKGTIQLCLCVAHKSPQIPFSDLLVLVWSVGG